MTLPAGLPIALDPAVRRHAAGRVLAGGPGGRILTLSAAGARALDELRDGTARAPAALALGRRLLDAGLAHPRPAARPQAGDVTVVIPVHDRPAALEALLAQLGDAHPVLVVDDGSADGVRVAASCERHRARLLRRPRNGGPAAARNTALAAVDTALVAFLDSDCRPPADWLDVLGAHFQDPAVVAVAPRIRPRPPLGRGVRARYAAARSPLDLGPREGPVGPGRPITYVPTAALVVRRSALDGFDERLRYGEDVDAIWRLHDAGGRVRYEPRVEVEHEEPAGWRALLTRRLRYGTSAAPLARRHPGRLAPLVVRPWPAATALAVLAGRPVLAGGLYGTMTLRLGRRASASGLPRAWAVPWTAHATLRTGAAAGRAATMFAAPVLLAALTRRRLRGPAATLLLLPPLTEWATRRPALDPVRWSLAAIADDAAYGTGVLLGCGRHRTLAPLRPAARMPT